MGRLGQLCHLLLLMAATLCGAEVQAQEEDLDQFPTFGTEVRVGLYRPTLSTSAPVKTVRDRIFGAQSRFYNRPLVFSIEFDYYPFNQVFGLLGGYGRVGYWRDGAASRKCLSPTVTDPTNPEYVIPCNAETILQSVMGNDTASINIIPTSLGFVYRYDMLRRNLAIPLVFSAKLGVDYYVWWGSVGNTTPIIAGTHSRARGGVLGLSASASIALALDAFSSDRTPVYGMEKKAQYNYVFLEYAIQDGKYLFSNKPFLDMSDYAVVTLGLSLDIL